jgi:hypothetical protein
MVQHIATPNGSSSSSDNFVLIAVFITNIDPYCEVTFDFDIALLQDLQSKN